MPRRLLRDGQVVDDEWQYLTEIEAVADASTAANADAAGHAVDKLIITFDRWQSERDRWSVATNSLGVMIKPADKVEQLASDMARFALIAAEFPGPSDGRGYTQGRLLRERYRFTGELRAAGYVRRDQLFFLARCGFNSFELPANELETGANSFATFSAEYQPSNDAGLSTPLQRR